MKRFRGFIVQHSIQIDFHLTPSGWISTAHSTFTVRDRARISSTEFETKTRLSDLVLLKNFWCEFWQAELTSVPPPPPMATRKRTNIWRSAIHVLLWHWKGFVKGIFSLIASFERRVSFVTEGDTRWIARVSIKFSRRTMQAPLLPPPLPLLKLMCFSGFDGFPLCQDRKHKRTRARLKPAFYHCQCCSLH
jgi:hypothetical protein